MVSKMFYLQPSLGRLTTNQSCDTLYVSWVLLFCNCRCSPPGLQRTWQKMNVWSLIWVHPEANVAIANALKGWFPSATDIAVRRRANAFEHRVFSISFWMIHYSIQLLHWRLKTPAPPVTLMSTVVQQLWGFVPLGLGFSMRRSRLIQEDWPWTPFALFPWSCLSHEKRADFKVNSAIQRWHWLH